MCMRLDTGVFKFNGVLGLALVLVFCFEAGALRVRIPFSPSEIAPTPSGSGARVFFTASRGGAFPLAFVEDFSFGLKEDLSFG